MLPGISPSDIDALVSFTNKSGIDAARRYVLGRCFLAGVDLRTRYHALYHGFDCYPAVRHDFAVVQKMQREGESGRQKLNQYTRYLTVLILSCRLRST